MSAPRGAADGPAVFVGPGAAPVLYEAVREGGGRLVESHTAAEALVWSDKDVESLARHLHDGLRWVQLPDVGVERWLAAGMITFDPVFTSARGCYGHQVAEHALSLLLAAARRLPECVNLSAWPTEDRPTGRSLRGAVVVVVGAGDIGTSLISMLEPLGAEILAVTRSGRQVAGASESYGVQLLDEALRCAEHVVLAAPSTPETRGLIGAEQLRAMRADAWLVNVGRGDLVQTDALVEAFASGRAGRSGERRLTSPTPSRFPPDTSSGACRRC